ncbi:MAG: hypothetical protein R3F30_07460 [Planctomycetota bacterium]
MRGTRRARLTALQSGGAIPDLGEYRVLLEPEGSFVGTVHEDFAVEANKGDIFQLGNASWRILRVEKGTVRVADAKGQPPTLPFWIAEGPARSRELSRAVGEVRVGGQDPRWLVAECGLDERAAQHLAEYLQAGDKALGTVPTQDCVVLERFFDESGGMQLVLHSCFGGQINRAYGLALRKRFCRGFGYELQAASNEDGLVLSLGMQHSFRLDDVWDYLHPDDRARHLCGETGRARAALVHQPLALERDPLMLERMRNGPAGADPPPADRGPPGPVVPGRGRLPRDPELARRRDPREHPVVFQTIEDCLRGPWTSTASSSSCADHRQGDHQGRRRHAEPSPFARSITNTRCHAPSSTTPRSRAADRRDPAAHTRPARPRGHRQARPRRSSACDLAAAGRRRGGSTRPCCGWATCAAGGPA